MNYIVLLKSFIGKLAYIINVKCSRLLSDFISCMNLYIHYISLHYITLHLHFFSVVACQRYLCPYVIPMTMNDFIFKNLSLKTVLLLIVFCVLLVLHYYSFVLACILHFGSNVAY